MEKPAHHRVLLEDNNRYKITLAIRILSSTLLKNNLHCVVVVVVAVMVVVVVVVVVVVIVVVVVVEV